MGKVKMKDLHKLLDLVDEVTGKTDLFISLNFVSFGGKDKYFGVSLVAYEHIPKINEEDTGLNRLFDEDFYVGETILAKTEPYVRCRDYLENIIREADVNV